MSTRYFSVVATARFLDRRDTPWTIDIGRISYEDEDAPRARSTTPPRDDPGSYALGEVVVRPEPTPDTAALYDLSVPADDPLIIEWPEVERHECLQGSSATVVLISPSDRAFADLYAIQPASVGVRIYRAGQLYWSGTLDPELYQEPYVTDKGYEVTLTFTDLGILDRIEADLDIKGAVTCRDMILMCADRAGLTLGAPAIREAVTTETTDGRRPVKSGDIALAAANFVDESGKPMTLYEALKTYLAPMGWRLMQRGGTLWLYDLGEVWYNKATVPTEVSWTGTERTLSVAKTYNAIRVNLSAYPSSSLMLPEDMEFEGVDFEKQRVNLNALPSQIATVGWGVTYYSYLTDIQQSSSLPGHDLIWLDVPVDYTLYTTQDIDTYMPSVEYINVGDGVMVGYFQAIEGSEEEVSAVIIGHVVKTAPSEDDPNIPPGIEGHGAPLHMLAPIRLPVGSPAGFSTPEFWTAPRQWFSMGVDIPSPTISEDNASVPLAAVGIKAHAYLRLVLPLLLSCRYNPFRVDTDSGREAANNGLISSSQYLFVPVYITLEGEDGSTWYYDNDAIARNRALGMLGLCDGVWRRAINGLVPHKTEDGSPTSPGHPDDGQNPVARHTAWLAYYDKATLCKDGSLGNKDGIIGKGWAQNEHCIGRADRSGLPIVGYEHKKFAASARFAELPSGQYIPYPPVGGRLTLTVYSGIKAWGTGDHAYYFDNFNEWVGTDIQGYTRYSDWQDRSIADYLRWMAFGAPTIEIVAPLTGKAQELPDIELTAKAEEDAAEECSIDLNAGTPTVSTAAAMATLLSADAYGEPQGALGKISRHVYLGGRKIPQADTPERLMITMLLSQYNERADTLAGSMELPRHNDALYVWTDANMPGARLIATAEAQHIIEGESDVTLTRIYPITYQTITPVNDND